MHGFVRTVAKKGALGWCRYAQSWSLCVCIYIYTHWVRYCGVLILWAEENCVAFSSTAAASVFVFKAACREASLVQQAKEA